MKNTISRIIITGLIVGTLDILAALIHYFAKTGKNPLIVLKFIASGVFGKSAFSDGLVWIFAGLSFHYIIAFLFTIFFFWLFPKVRNLVKNEILTGIIYSLFVWVVMNLIVVPLSNTPPQPFNLMNAFVGIIILIVCMGIPLAVMVNSFYNNEHSVSSSE